MFLCDALAIQIFNSIERTVKKTNMYLYIIQNVISQNLSNLILILISFLKLITSYIHIDKYLRG